MEQVDRDFADEMIRQYGEDRFYHSCKRTGGANEAFGLHMQLNGNDREKSLRFLASIGISSFEPRITAPEGGRETMCRIAYGLVRYYKEFALRDHRLPAVLNARMILGESNDWVRKYSELLRTFPDWE